MSAQYGIARMLYGTEAGAVMFVAITDGKRVDYLPAASGGWNITPGESDLRVALDGRVSALLENTPDGTDPESMLSAIGYNMPLSIEEGQVYPTWDAAYAAAQVAVSSAVEGAQS
jgi:hypothetical protein